MKELLTSKRIWVVILTFAAMILAKFGFKFDTPGLEQLADTIITAIGAVMIIITKVMDAKKAKQDVPAE